MRFFLDSNILIYAASVHREFQAKRVVASDILEKRHCILSVQVLNEFVWQSTHSRRPDRISSSDARDLTTTWGRFETVPLDRRLFDLT